MSVIRSVAIITGAHNDIGHPGRRGGGGAMHRMAETGRLIGRRPLRSLATFAVSAMLVCAAPSPAPAQQPSSDSNWVEAFQSSPARYQFDTPDALAKTAAALREAGQAIMAPPEVTGTVRFRFAVAAAGKRIRVRLSNEERDAALPISHVTVGLAGEGLAAREGSLRTVTFSGGTAVKIARRAPALSDPVDLPVAAGTELVVSVVLSRPLPMNPAGYNGMEVAAGDQSLSAQMSGGKIVPGRPLVSGVLVEAARPMAVIAALGDSITDGNKIAVTALRGWPEQFSRRLLATGRSDRMTIVNAGISGNRVVSDGFGVSALARLDRDVLRLPGVTHLIVLEGINDIGLAGQNPLLGGQPELDQADLIAGYRQIIARSRAAGIKVLLGTITPFAGAAYHTDMKERQRQFVNDWIRSSGEADGVIDFDQALRDPSDPLKLLPAYDSGDHLHPSEAGMRKMGDAVDLRLFD